VANEWAQGAIKAEGTKRNPNKKEGKEDSNHSIEGAIKGAKEHNVISPEDSLVQTGFQGVPFDAGQELFGYGFHTDTSIFKIFLIFEYSRFFLFVPSLYRSGWDGFRGPVRGSLYLRIIFMVYWIPALGNTFF
jgi:hypothetical protein